MLHELRVPNLTEYVTLAKSFEIPHASDTSLASRRFRSYLRTYPELVAHFAERPMT